MRKRAETAAILFTSTVLTCITLSCAVNRVIYNRYTEEDGLMAKVVVLECPQLDELVITMQEQGEPLRESVYHINWLPDHYTISDINGDSIPDMEIISTSEESHIFLGTESGFSGL